MSSRILSLTVLAALAWAGTATGQQFVQIPGGFWANDISADGKVVVGDALGGGGFYWHWRTDPLPTNIGGRGAVAVSDDGSKILGNIDNPAGSGSLPAIWSQASGWVPLPTTGSCGSISHGTAYDLSGDGTVATGLAWVGCDAFGFRWTQAGGTQLLEQLGNGTNRSSVVSGDGQVLGGFAQGSFSRTPAVWQADLSGVMYDFDALGEVHGLNSDGTTVVGEFNGSAFMDTGSGPQLLGTLNPGWVGIGVDPSEDGSIIAGFDVTGLAREAWVWTQATGIQRLSDVMASLGVTGLPPLAVCRAISDDGNVVVGGFQDGLPGGTGGFIVEFNSTPWVDLGGGTAGALGQPVFDASGDLTAGSTLTLELSNAPSSAIFLMWISLSSNPANVVGGTLYPLPADVKLVLAADALGGFNIATTVAAGAPSGVDLWFQCLVQDATNIHGITLSNAMRGTTP
jgi:hypothetical protein